MFSKTTKKVVALALILSLALSSAVVAPTAKPADAAKKLTINKKKLSMKVGQKAIKLTANQKATWTSSAVSKVAIDKAATNGSKTGKSIKITAQAPGKATITAKVGSATAKCTVTVSKAASGTVIYNLATETGKDDETGKTYAAPQKSNYSEFKYSSYAIWLCRATFFDPANDGRDFRGQKLKCSITFKNSGKRDLPELGFCFNYTKGGASAYPFVLHIKKGMTAKVKKLANHKNCKNVNSAIKKGKTYTYTFTTTIPKNAMNGDKDSETNKNYPIMFYLANLKDGSPYKPGDEVTILKCKWTVA